MLIKNNQVKINNQLINYYYFSKKNNPEITLFLHGFGANPSFYKSFLDELIKYTNIIAPCIYGVNYLKNQPQTIDDYLDLTINFKDKLKLDNCYLMGHSIGATISINLSQEYNNFKKVFCYNPIVPQYKKYFSFFYEKILIDLKNFFNCNNSEIKSNKIDFFLNYYLPYTYNFLKKPIKSTKILKEICDYNYKKNKCKSKTKAIFSLTDEFFKLDDLRIFYDLDIIVKKIPVYGHEWLIFNPKKALNCFNNPKVI
jgi:hypothetical protein